MLSMQILMTDAYHAAVSAHEDACVWTNVAVDIQECNGNFCVFQLCFSNTEYTELWLLCQGAPIHRRLLRWHCQIADAHSVHEMLLTCACLSPSRSGLLCERFCTT